MSSSLKTSLRRLSRPSVASLSEAVDIAGHPDAPAETRLEVSGKAAAVEGESVFEFFSRPVRGSGFQLRRP